MSEEAQQEVPQWISDEIQDAWDEARYVYGLQCGYSILDRLVDRLGRGNLSMPPLRLSDVIRPKIQS